LIKTFWDFYVWPLFPDANSSFHLRQPYAKRIKLAPHLIPVCNGQSTFFIGNRNELVTLGFCIC